MSLVAITKQCPQRVELHPWTQPLLVSANVEQSFHPWPPKPNSTQSTMKSQKWRGNIVVGSPWRRWGIPTSLNREEKDSFQCRDAASADENKRLPTGIWQAATDVGLQPPTTTRATALGPVSQSESGKCRSGGRSPEKSLLVRTGNLDQRKAARTKKRLWSTKRWE